MENTCKRGIVACIDDNGNYAPFLVQSRDKDIIWNRAELSVILKNLFGIEVSDDDIDIPRAKINMIHNSWSIMLDANGTFTIQKRIPLTSFTLNYDSNEFSCSVSLPFQVLNNATLSVSGLINSSSAVLRKSTLCTNISSTSTNISEFTVLIDKFSGTYASGWANLPDYNTSTIFVTVSGKLA